MFPLLGMIALHLDGLGFFVFLPNHKDVARAEIRTEVGQLQIKLWARPERL